MKQRISILILALLLVCNLLGCTKKADETNDKKIEDLSRPAQSAEVGEDNTDENAGSEEDALPDEINAEGEVLLSDVRKEILAKCEIKDSMDIETEALSRLYGIEGSDVKQSASFVTMSGTFPHEVIMIEAVDTSAADEIAALLENRVSEVRIQSQSYDAKNYALALECKVYKNKNFVSLFLSPDHQKITEVYSKYVK